MNHLEHDVRLCPRFTNLIVINRSHKDWLAGLGLRRFGIITAAVAGLTRSCSHPYLQMFRGGLRCALQTGWPGLGRHACSQSLGMRLGIARF